jgi:uncharacterized caspase-like protein
VAHSLQERPCAAKPKNDATDVAEALKLMGFDTIVGLDLEKAGMEETSLAHILQIELACS